MEDSVDFEAKLRMFCDLIETEISSGKRKFAIVPYGNNGWLFEELLTQKYSIVPIGVFDNNVSKFCSFVKDISNLKSYDSDDLVVVITCENQEVHNYIEGMLKEMMSKAIILDLFFRSRKVNQREKQLTKCGKYSYGPLCNHEQVKEVGAFCSFAVGVDVVGNHLINTISTHPFLFHDKRLNDTFLKTYEERKDATWFFPGVSPLIGPPRRRRITIGNDVWLGANVLITNGVDIPDGVIAGAGAVITKEIPPYAIVGGVPARIIGYRYNSEQVAKIRAIAWWDWPDELIRERYRDFYLSGDEFIDKYYSGD